MAIVSATDWKLAAQVQDRLQATQGRLQRAFDVPMVQTDSEAQRGLVLQAKESLVNYFAARNDKLRGTISTLSAVTLIAVLVLGGMGLLL